MLADLPTVVHRSKHRSIPVVSCTLSICVYRRFVPGYTNPDVSNITIPHMATLDIGRRHATVRLLQHGYCHSTLTFPLTSS